MNIRFREPSRRQRAANNLGFILAGLAVVVAIILTIGIN